jgi:hypothetical protein
MHAGSVYLCWVTSSHPFLPVDTLSAKSIFTAKALLSSTSIECGRQGSKRGEGRFHLIYQLQGRNLASTERRCRCS